MRWAWLTSAAVVLVACGGCMPRALLVEQQHLSSAAQHFAHPPTNWGVNATMLLLHWQAGVAYADIGEGVSYQESVVPSHPETFEARVGVAIPLWGAR